MVMQKQQGDLYIIDMTYRLDRFPSVSFSGVTSGGGGGAHAP